MSIDLIVINFLFTEVLEGVCRRGVDRGVHFK